MTDSHNLPTHLLAVVTAELQKMKAQSDRAIAQLRDEDLFFQLNPDQNSISVIMKHLAGNMLSRWTEFRTTDGEKPWRMRDDEFVERVVPRNEMIEYWERGWKCLFEAMNSIQPDELMRTITIREEPMALFHAINRQTAHYGYHVGQIVLLAKHIRGKDRQYADDPARAIGAVQPANEGAMHEAILSLLKSADSFAVAEEIQKEGSSVEIAKRYEQVVLDLYWKAKDLPAVVCVAHFGLSYCLSQARQGDHATWLLDSAKKIAYNLASFCWTGWDEPGITITEGDLQIGFDSAKLNLRLGIELNRPPLGMSMAYWMLGAYALAFRDYPSAAARFRQAMAMAEKAKDAGQITQNEGFLALARLGEKDAQAEADFARVLELLETENTDDSKEFARQLRVARHVFQL